MNQDIVLETNFDKLPKVIREKLCDANVFFTKELYNYTKKSGQYMIYAFDNERIVPICVSKKMMLQFALFVSEPFSYRSSNKALKAYLDEVIKKLKKRTRIAWITTSAGSLFDAYPTDSVRIPFGSHVVDLTQSEEQLWSNVHSKHRNSIRRAEKGNVTIKSGGKELIDDYNTLDKATWARSGKEPYGRKFFENIIDGLGDKAIIVIAYKDSVPQAGGLFYLNTQMSYYMYGTSADEPEPGSANLLQWKTMLQFKKLGIMKYSFVGCRINEDEESKYHNIQRFKERFGGELCQGYMFRTVLHPLLRKAFMAIYKLKNKRELVDVIDDEIEKWPELNQQQ